MNEDFIFKNKKYFSRVNEILTKKVSKELNIDYEWYLKTKKVKKRNYKVLLVDHIVRKILLRCNLSQLNVCVIIDRSDHTVIINSIKYIEGIKKSELGTLVEKIYNSLVVKTIIRSVINKCKTKNNKHITTIKDSIYEDDCEVVDIVIPKVVEKYSLIRKNGKEYLKVSYLNKYILFRVITGNHRLGTSGYTYKLVNKKLGIILYSNEIQTVAIKIKQLLI